MSAKIKVVREAQAARLMGVSQATLSRWRREKKIRHWRQRGRIIRYTPEDIDLNIAEMDAMRPRVIERSVTEARFG